MAENIVVAPVNLRGTKVLGGEVLVTADSLIDGLESVEATALELGNLDVAAAFGEFADRVRELVARLEL